MRVALLMLVAACDGSAPDEELPIDAPAAVTFPLRIVVTDRTVDVYTNDADRVGCPSPVTFPEAGACTSISDVGCAAPSCISDMWLHLDGHILPIDVFGRPGVRTFAAPAAFGAGALSLEISGCGHGTTQIALGDTTSGPSVNAIVEANGISWTTDSTGSEALVMVSSPVESALCRVDGETMFSSNPIAPQQLTGARVQPLSPAMQIDTLLGPTTIWHAGDATVTL